jgi:hypothetical protein
MPMTTEQDPTPAASGLDAPDLPWLDISELEQSDDLFWFLRRDLSDWIVDGPRTPQAEGYDADEWDWFAPCESPPTQALAAQPAPGVGGLELLRNFEVTRPDATKYTTDLEGARIAASREHWRVRADVHSLLSTRPAESVAQHCDCPPMKCTGEFPSKACRFAIMREAGANPVHPSVSVAQGGEEWRCFHCGEVFTDREAAALHFGDYGPRSYTDAHCLIDAPKLRDMEFQLQRYQEEDGPIHRLMHRQAGEHTQALIRAEEAGYAKALKDTNYSASPTPATGSGGVFPPRAFEEWFAGIEAGDGTIPIPQSVADGQAYHDHIGRRQVALGAWLAATEAAHPAPAGGGAGESA